MIKIPSQKLTELDMIRAINKRGVETERYIGPSTSQQLNRRDPSIVLARKTKSIPLAFVVTRVPDKDFLARNPSVHPLTKALNKPAVEIFIKIKDEKFFAKVENGKVWLFDPKRPAEEPISSMALESIVKTGELVNEELIKRALELAPNAFLTMEAKLRKNEKYGQILRFSMHFGVEEETDKLVLLGDLDPQKWVNQKAQKESENLQKEKEEKRAGIPERKDRWGK